MTYLAVFVVALLESLAVVGLAVPGAAMVAAAGAAARAGHLSPALVVFAAAVGAFCGDALSYAVGSRLHAWPRAQPYFARHAKALARTERFVARWGIAAVIIGRFFAPTRGFVPLIAGMGGMHRLGFTVANALGAVAWAGGMVVLGEQAVALHERLGTQLTVALLAAATALLGAVLLLVPRRR